MYKVTVQSLDKKLLPEDYKKYFHIRNLLAQYNKNREYIEGMRNVQYSAQDLQQFLKEFRRKQKMCNLQYKVDYEITSKVWKKVIGKVGHEFKMSYITDQTLAKNLKHFKLHKEFLVMPSKMEHLNGFKEKIREKYREARRVQRQVRIHRKSKALRALGITINYEICGGIFHQRIKPVFGRGESPRGYLPADRSGKDGLVMRFMKSKDKQIVFQEKKPQTKDNYVGVEIEFFCDLNNEDLSFKLFEHGLGKYVFLNRDGSIKEFGQMFPHEVCILAKEKEIEEVISQVSKVLLAANAKVNKTCGMHVHLDMRNRDHLVAFHNLVSAQNILFAMNPFSRQSGKYCKRMDTKNFKEAVGNGEHDRRYVGINPMAHSKHNTIEIRIHSGTVQASKINNWIRLLLYIINKKEAVKNTASSLKGFVKQFEIAPQLAMYIAERMKKFVGEDKKDAEEKGAA